MKSGLLRATITGLLLLPQPVFADEATDFICNAGQDRFGGELPRPTEEQTQAILPQVLSHLSASTLLKVAHQCALDTADHAALLFRAADSLRCAPGTILHETTIATVNHDEETNYKAAVLFNGARESSADDVRSFCAEVAEINPDLFEVTSLEQATELGRLVGSFESKLRSIRYGN